MMIIIISCFVLRGMSPLRRSMSSDTIDFSISHPYRSNLISPLSIFIQKWQFEKIGTTIDFFKNEVLKIEFQ